MPVNKSDLNFFELLAQQVPQTLTLEQMRQAAKGLSQFVGVPAELSFQDGTIQSRNGLPIRYRYYAESDEIKPLVIYFPGTGFIHQMFEENHTIISKIAKQSGCNAVMIDYCLAPENPYPKPLEDAIDAFNYIINNLKKFHADPSKIILAGWSSGANLAAVLTNLSRANPDVSIFHQLLISGGFDYTNSVHEYDDYAIQDKMLDPVAAQFSFDCYCNESQRADPMCSPYWEPDLSGLPPTTILCGEYDGGRSQTEAYIKKLIQAGNSVNKIIMPGQTHMTILLRKACYDGDDPSEIAAKAICRIL
ncbi:MAG: alpha/beta hydrolase [Legionella sp.]|nr:alpha/beta hydrolase [Legionella sp.]